VLALPAHLPTYLPSPQVLYGVNQRLRVEDVDSPLVAQRPVKSIALVIVTGDRGLCGGYNK
jgi:F-type H+-transporting ATPase subunit gamma